MSINGSEMQRTTIDNLGYFDEHPAPLLEGMAKLSPASAISSTTPFYGPMLYTISRAIQSQFSLEIGVAQGWCSGFMAWAIKENNTRNKLNGRHWGIDLDPELDLEAGCKEYDLPATFFSDPLGSVHFLENQKVWYPGQLDLVFIDSYHNNDYLVREVELIHPYLKAKGDGYLVLHDIYAFLEGGYQRVLNDPRYKWESVRFLHNYGLAILRNMVGYDYEKVYWPEGDQHFTEYVK